MIKKITSILAFSSVLFFLLASNSYAANSWPAGTGTDIGTNLSPSYEPSGLAWHSRLGTLFLVGDGGDVTEMTDAGTILHTADLSGNPDLEGIAVADPNGNYVYLAVENTRIIKEFDISSWSETGKSWDLSSWMQSSPTSGMEALTFVPNGDHPFADSASGGLFYAGSQYDGKIYVFDINLSLSNSVSYISTIAPLTISTDLSGLDYVNSTKMLYAIFDSSNLLLEMNASGTVLNSYDMPGSAQEGVAVQPSCPNATTNIYLAEDATPQILKYSNYPNYYQNCTEYIDAQKRAEAQSDLDNHDKIYLSNALSSYTFTGQKLDLYFKDLPSNLTSSEAYYMKWQEYDKYPPKWADKEDKALKRYWKLETNLKNYVPADDSQKYHIKLTFKYSKHIYQSLKKKQSDLKKSEITLKVRTKKTDWQKIKGIWKNTKIVHNKTNRQFSLKNFTKFKKTNYWFGIGIK